MRSLLTASRRLSEVVLGTVLGRALEVLDASLWDGGEDADAAMPARAGALPAFAGAPAGWPEEAASRRPALVSVGA